MTIHHVQNPLQGIKSVQSRHPGAALLEPTRASVCLQALPMQHQQSCHRTLRTIRFDGFDEDKFKASYIINNI